VAALITLSGGLIGEAVRSSNPTKASMETDPPVRPCMVVLARTSLLTDSIVPFSSVWKPEKPGILLYRMLLQYGQLLYCDLPST